MSPRQTSFVRPLAAALGVALTALIVWAFLRGDFGAELDAITTMPWGIVTLSDLYIGFVLYVLAVLAVEGRTWRAAVWSVPVFVLGNVWACVWILVRWRAIMARLDQRGGQLGDEAAPPSS
jgi:hypothetical protein